jgi:catechol 2,3-dioxygenase-like lactoylglutathione lyase family enzyme
MTGVKVRQPPAVSSLPARLTVLTLGAHDLPALRRFYRGLGWEEVAGSDDGWSGFLLGGVLLALYPVDDLTAEAAPGAARPEGGWSGVTLACDLDRREDVDTAFRAALAAGAEAVAGPTDRQWGGRSAYIADPEGNHWELAWAATARFDARGGR